MPVCTGRSFAEHKSAGHHHGGASKMSCHVRSPDVALRCWCVRAGHALGQKDHEADRWVAATAMWLGVPVVAHDAIFANVEGLNLLTKLDL
jgi:hypothetical protein